MLQNRLSIRNQRVCAAVPHPLVRLLILASALLATGSTQAVNISELQYDPPGHDSGLEFIEVVNDGPTVVDLSRWFFSEGVEYVFPAGTLVPAGEHVVICADTGAFQSRYPGVSVLGTFAGRLDSDGEALVLSNNGGGEVVKLRYSYKGKWPSLPAGTGHTLSLLRPRLDASEPESWSGSLQRGGTPGRLNFFTGGADETQIVRLGETWVYRKGTQEFSSPPDAWRQPGFGPLGWLSGTTGIGYGDGDDATVLLDMSGNYWSVAARTTFTLSAEEIADIDELVLANNYDDGFVAYLNGTEVVRASMPGSPGDPVPYDTAAISHEAGVEERFTISRDLLAEGVNVLALQAHNTTLGSSDLSMAPRLLRRKILVPEGDSPPRIVFNEFFGRTTGPRWVEIHNAGEGAYDLSGFWLSDTPDLLEKHPIPPGTQLAGGGFLVVTETESGLDFTPAEVRLYLTRPDSSAVLAAAVFENLPQDNRVASRQGYSDARYPDGEGRFAYAALPTPGQPNLVDLTESVVINEILYHPPAGNSAGEFIEIYNRSEDPVDLSDWAFTKGISFTFPSDVSIPAGGYLVVAADPEALEDAHGISGVLGPWTGVLSNSGENLRLVDAVGNIVDEVRYYDGGRWSRWADGGGSSIELVDPWQDNSLPAAWDGSDESGKSEWVRISYSDVYSVEADSELHLLLLDEGTALVDDISLVRTGTPDEYIPNGDFELGTGLWRFLGTHVGSRRVVTEAPAGNACLELDASGPGDNNLNKIETDTDPIMSTGGYTVSFWARWLRGANKILSRADSRRGASLSRAHELPIPHALGTPGGENSARIALKSVQADGNLGPVIGRVTQDPVTPTAGSSVRVLAYAHDADGVEGLTLHYRTGGLGDGVFTRVPMFDDGAHGDEAPEDGWHAGSIAGYPQGTRVVFYIEGTDQAGEVRRFPVEAPTRTLLYAVESPSSSPVLVSRLNLTDEDESALDTRFLHSDDLVDASFVLDDEEIYYNVGVRYHGSPWNRPPNPKMYRVRFNEDRPFIRNLKAMNLSRYGSAQNEGTAYFCVQSASTPRTPAPVGEYLYTQVYHNTQSHGRMAIIETVDNRYIDKWFPDDTDGYILKLPGRRYFNDSGQMAGVEWSTFAYRGSKNRHEFERYRWYFTQGARQVEDNWGPLVDLCSAMDTSRTSNAVFDATITEILDVEQFLRVEAPRVLQDDWDTVGIGNGQNAYMYFAPREGRWKLLPWDMDHTFGNVNAKLYPEGSESQVTRLVQRPQFRRLYLQIVGELLETAWDPDTIRRYLVQTQAETGLGGSGILNFIQSRRPLIEALFPSDITFRLTGIGIQMIPPDWSGVISSANSQEKVRGTAPLEVKSLVVLRNGEQLDLDLTWSTVTAWYADFPLLPGVENDFEILGFDSHGRNVATISFRIASTADLPPPVVLEIEPVYGPAAGGTFVEISGSGFQEGARVHFGPAEALEVVVLSSTGIQAVTPPGAGAVPVIVTNVDQQTGELPAAFEYVPSILLVRGDASLDGIVDITDAIQILTFEFLGDTVLCLEAADIDDNGTLDISDPISLLNFLFLGGQQPAPPYPDPGPDPDGDSDGLDCEEGV